MSDVPEQTLYERIYDVVRQVPAGMVATYGDIATLVGGCDARSIGYALNDLPKGLEQEVPWQRIVNSQGRISTRGPRQRQLLEEEGVVFDARDRIPLDRYRWGTATPEQVPSPVALPLPFDDPQD